MRCMTKQTIFNLHLICMGIMTIKTGLVLSFGQAMFTMALETILLCMGTGNGSQQVADIFMAGYTNRLAFLKSLEVSDKGRVGRMATGTVFKSKMGTVVTVMT